MYIAITKSVFYIIFVMKQGLGQGWLEHFGGEYGSKTTKVLKDLLALLALSKT